jgi:hypothetical protein
MKRIILSIATISIAALAWAGNPARTGTAGATELMINPWANSSGWNGVNSSNVKGVDAFNLNIGGLSQMNSTSVAFTYTDYLHLAGIKINSFGLAQKLGSSSYIGLTVFSMNFGDIQRTDVNNPDGGIGTYSPRFSNIALGYAYKFSDAITCGLVFRGISEAGASDVNARSACMDAGVQYSAKSPGERARDNELKGRDIHLGISLRNVGVNGVFSGDGLSYQITDADGISRTMQMRSLPFQLPTQLHIGLSYDIRLDRDTTDKSYNNRLTIAGNFTSNAYANNQFGLGFEYGFKKIFALRAGYQYENNIMDNDLRINAFSGFAAGASIYIPLKKGSTDNLLAFDYSYRDSRFLGATHSIGVRIELGESKN